MLKCLKFSNLHRLKIEYIHLVNANRKPWSADKVGDVSAGVGRLLAVETVIPNTPFENPLTMQKWLTTEGLYELNTNAKQMYMFYNLNVLFMVNMLYHYSLNQNFSRITATIKVKWLSVYALC